MAKVFAIHSDCRSIGAFLQGSYPASVAELPMPPWSFVRIWRALGAPYRLSAAYTARVVRLDADQPPPDEPPLLVINT